MQLVLATCFVLIKIFDPVLPVCVSTGFRGFKCSNFGDLEDVDFDSKMTVEFKTKSGEFLTLKQSSIKKADMIKTLIITKTLGHIKPDAFNNFTSVETIRLEDNIISEIQSNTFQNIPVKFLYLFNNSLKSIHLDAFKSLDKLEELDLKNNGLTLIKEKVFSHLPAWFLNFEYNEIAYIENKAFYYMDNLLLLCLSHNKLTKFVSRDIINTDKMIELLLQNNKIVEIGPETTEGFFNLETFNISNNLIEHIKPGTFLNCPNLRRLSLSRNRLKQIHENIFPNEGMFYLVNFSIKSNKLRYLSNRLLEEINLLDVFALMGNPWDCDCLDIILNWMKKHKIKHICHQDYFDGKRATCLATASDTHNCSFDNTNMSIVFDTDNEDNIFC